MRNKVYLIVGAPGAGKTWVCNRLSDKLTYIPHDAYKEEAYFGAILKADQSSAKPLLIETPFSISKLKTQLERERARLEIVFIDDNEDLIAKRYTAREGGKAYPQGHRTRIHTYRARAKEYGSFIGTSDQVLAYLTQLP